MNGKRAKALRRAYFNAPARERIRGVVPVEATRFAPAKLKPIARSLRAWRREFGA